MKRLMMLFAACSLLGCDTRPDAFVGIVNAPKKQIRGYNLKKDYDSDGNLKPGAKGETRPAREIMDLNKYICTDPDGFAAIKSSMKSMRDELEQCRSWK